MQIPRRFFFYLLLGIPILFLSYVLFEIRSQPTTLLQIKAGGPGSAYLAQFADFRSGDAPLPCDPKAPGLSQAKKLECYRGLEEFRRVAPDKSAELHLEYAPFTHPLGGCHELWVDIKNRGRRRIIKLSEGDPGSGRSFGWGWSKDSKAVFIAGATAGINCRGDRYREFGAIYTLADDNIWEVPL